MASQVPSRLGQRWPALAAFGLIALWLAIPLAVTAAQAAISATAQGVVSGGGTVGDASFGLNSVRPSTFPNGQALGRIDYQKPATVPNGHVNVPVILKSVQVGPTVTPNGTGGQADIIGDCTATDTNTVCPTAPAGSPPITHVLVHTEDVADDGANSDQFRIMYLNCSGTPIPSTTPGGTPTNCTVVASEGGLLSTGNIQVRPPP